MSNSTLVCRSRVLADNNGRSGGQAPAVEWTSEVHARRRRFRYAISAAHHASLFLGKNFPRSFPFVFVTGYPKSGTTWAAQLIADCLYLPNPQHSLLPVGCPAIIQTHANYCSKFRRSVYMMRDGRDAIVSHYFHLAARQGSGARSTWRRRQVPGLGNPDDLRDNLSEFIRGQARRPHSSPSNWADHVQSFLRQQQLGAALLRYEDLHTDGVTAVMQSLKVIAPDKTDVPTIKSSLEKYSFRRLSGRSNGNERNSSYLRRGQAGRWKDYFNYESARTFQHYFGSALIDAGYERDDSWVEKVRQN